MKVIGLCFALLLFYLSFSSMPKNVNSTNITQKKLCQYDNYCLSIYDENGQIFKVAPSIKKLLSFLSKDIKSTALKYEVDPRALAGVIAAEHTLNVSIEDDIQNFLASYGVTSVFGKKFSYGLGQIFQRVALKVDPIVARTENRKLYSKNQVAQALTKPKESLKYMSAVLKDAINKYKDAGFDISDNIEVLTTLYNIGKIDERLKKTSKNKTLLPNYFGVFIKTNIKDIEDSIGWSKDAGDYTPKFNINNKTYYNHNYFDHEIISYLAPDHCTLIYNQKTKSKETLRTIYNSNPPTKGSFQVLRTTLSCKSERWSLIKFRGGSIGWVRNSTLEKSSIKNTDPNEKNNVNLNCPSKTVLAKKINSKEELNISFYYYANCYLIQEKPNPVTNSSNCNFDVINSAKLIIDTLASKCYDLAMIPSNYYYNYLWENYPSLKGKIIFDNLPSNSFNFISSEQSNSIEKYLPKPN